MPPFFARFVSASPSFVGFFLKHDIYSRISSRFDMFALIALQAFVIKPVVFFRDMEWKMERFVEFLMVMGRLVTS